ncbi:MAG: PocR ligand-binding domain-containing protein [Lachnospiraceae bacterium]
MKQEPYLFSMIDKQKLAEILEAFFICIKVPIQVIDEHGEVLMAQGRKLNFCKPFMQYTTGKDSCRELHLSECQRSVEFGGSYIFSCHANLNHIAYPFLIKGSFFGSVLVGPFLMESPDSILILDIAKRYQMPMDTLLELYDHSGDIPLITPIVVTQIGKLISHLFHGLIIDSRLEFIAHQNRMDQQSRINESIQKYKLSGLDQDNKYPYEKEKALLTKVKTGNVHDAKGILNDLLGYVLFAEGNDFSTTKTRAIELSSLLSRTAIEGGASTNTILKINNEFLKKLNDTNSLDSLCLQLQEIVEVFTESMFNYIPDKNSDLIKKAFSYIAKHYSENLSLEDVASYVHLNPAYFSTLFKQSSGASFKEYLNTIRIEESKHLLSSTDYAIIDIAIAVGFEDQSYFSKVFKKYTGLTPRQYR